MMVPKGLLVPGFILIVISTYIIGTEKNVSTFSSLIALRLVHAHRRETVTRKYFTTAVCASLEIVLSQVLDRGLHVDYYKRCCSEQKG